MSKLVDCTEVCELHIAHSVELQQVQELDIKRLRICK